MKKIYLILVAAAGMTVASCTEESVVTGANEFGINGGESSAIVFSGSSAATTRADYVGAEAAGKLGNNFVVMGVKSDGTPVNENPVYDHYNVNYKANTANTTTSNTNDWEYVGQAKHAFGPTGDQTIKYWDYAKSQYDFIAYSKGTATAVYADGDYDKDANVQYTEITPATLTTSAYTIKGKASELAKTYIADLVTAYRTADYNKVVKFKFRSLSAKVRVALYETVPGYSVKDVQFYSAGGDASPNTTAKLYTTGSEVFNEEGTYTVYYPTTGSTKTTNTDYNKAHLSFVPAASTGTATVKGFGTLDNTNTGADPEDQEATGKVYLGRTSSEATYAGENTTENPHYYTIVIPNETGAVLNLKVNYTLVSTDGSGETIDVKGALAQVPAIYAKWTSGYAYTYIFKISQNTNGWTNPSAGPAGLFPITFNAVVTETEEGIQETITTVADPSITTYAKGAMVTANDEYLTGANIYVLVQGETLSATNSKLYTVTLANAAAQTINEASVANAIANGAWDGTKFTVHDANEKDMVVTTAAAPTIVTEIAAADAPSGNAITTNAAKFTPAAAGTYVFEYEKTAPVYDAGTVLAVDTSLKGYYTDAAGVKTRCSDSGTADGTTKYYKQTTAGEYVYKIIKVVAP